MACHTGVHDIKVVYIEDQRPTDRPTELAFWKILNDHISATGHPMHFMFRSRIGFSRSADRMALLPVGPNLNSGRRYLGKCRVAIFLQRVMQLTSRLVRGRVFGSADRMSLLPVGSNPRSRPSAALCNFEWP